jgi:hypothetical protein
MKSLRMRNGIRVNFFRMRNVIPAFYIPEQSFSFLRDKQVSFKFESLDLYIFILWVLKLFCGLRATDTTLNITYETRGNLDMESVF